MVINDQTFNPNPSRKGEKEANMKIFRENVATPSHTIENEITVGLLCPVIIIISIRLDSIQLCIPSHGRINMDEVAKVFQNQTHYKAFQMRLH